MTMKVFLISALFLFISACASSRAPVPETLPTSSWLPKAAPKAIILAAHSFSDYRASYNSIGPWFAKKGIAFYAYDQPGFGENPKRGLWAGTEGMITALEKEYATIRKNHPTTPLYLLGESMGGGTILSTLSNHPEWDVSGIILAAPGVREGIDYRYLYNAGLEAITTVYPSYSVFKDDREGPPLTKEAIERIKNDPNIVRNVRMDTYYGLIKLADYASDNAGKINAPLLLLFGGKDTAIAPTAICHLFARIGSEHKSFRYYKGEPHLLLQSPTYEAQLADVLGWIEKRPHKSTNTAFHDLCKDML
jgi:alpha-beta hydrolase superfamily lysophospholipase